MVLVVLVVLVVGRPVLRSSLEVSTDEGLTWQYDHTEWQCSLRSVRARAIDKSMAGLRALAEIGLVAYGARKGNLW